MKDGFRIRTACWQDDGLLLSGVRRTVFIEEQRVPEELEWDGFDAVCHHVLALDTAGQPIGTGRIKADGHIGRMAVLGQYRGQGVGSAILNALLEYAMANDYREVYLHAQCSAVGFYERHGFTVSSGEFMDAGIPHRTMVYASSRL